MSRVRVYLACSLDGFIAGPEHNLDWLQRDYSPPRGWLAAADALRFEGFMSQVGAMLMGRTTFDVVRQMGVWPYGECPVLVTTSRPLMPPSDTVRAVQGSIQELITEAQRVAAERDVYLDGGSLVRQALRADLVDEMVLTMVPVLLGAGIRLFEGLEKEIALQFVSHKSFEQGLLQVTLTRPSST